MEIKFDSLQASFLGQLRGLADLKTREADRAQQAANEARTILQKYLELLIAEHGLAGKPVQIMDDWSGFRVSESPVGTTQPGNGHAIVPPAP